MPIKLKRDPSTLRVALKRCDECLFTKRRLVSEARMEDILAECENSGTAFECHRATLAGDEYMCRGYYDEVQPLIARLARSLDRLVFVEHPAKAKE